MSDPAASTADRSAILHWMKVFETAVRSRDFAAGRALCSGRIVSFGTVAPCAAGLDQLESLQWRFIWPETEGFTFDISSLHCGQHAGACWVAVKWSSRGPGNSQPALRRGRATIILEPGETGLRAIHTHFSLVPSDSPSDPPPDAPGGRS